MKLSLIVGISVSAFITSTTWAAEEKHAGGNGYENEFANQCLQTIAKALVISAPTVGEQATVPGSDLTFFPCNHSWDCNVEKPPQVTTFEKSLLEKGATSAVVTSDGKVLQINPNGSCVLSTKRFESSYDFIGAQMQKADPATLGRILNAAEKKYVAGKCGRVSATGATRKIHEALVAAHLIDTPAKSTAADSSSSK